MPANTDKQLELCKSWLKQHVPDRYLEEMHIIMFFFKHNVLFFSYYENPEAAARFLFTEEDTIKTSGIPMTPEQKRAFEDHIYERNFIPVDIAEQPPMEQKGFFGDIDNSMGATAIAGYDRQTKRGRKATRNIKR